MIESSIETAKEISVYMFLFTRIYFISNVVLDSLKFKKILEIQGKS